MKGQKTSHVSFDEERCPGTVFPRVSDKCDVTLQHSGGSQNFDGSG